MRESPGEWLLALLFVAMAVGALIIVNILTDGELGRWIVKGLR